MKALLLGILARLLRVALWLRYRVRLDGLEGLQAQPGHGYLVLANHPAEIDPVILGVSLWQRLPVHPMVIEDFYHMPGLHFLFRALGAIPMPNMDGTAGPYKRLRVQAALDEAVARLRRGEHVLIYPSGRLMRSGREELLGTSAVHEILRREPGVRILLARSRGLLGSSFSWVAERQRPDLVACVRRGARYLLENLLVGMPRREVCLTLREAPADFPRQGSKVGVNSWLEAWFNEPGPEVPTVPSYSRWRELRPTLREAGAGAPVVVANVPPEVRAKVLKQIAALSGRPESELRDDLNLARDLGLDSLALAELNAWLDEEFLTSDVQPEDLQTLAGVLAAAVGQVSHREDNLPIRQAQNWPDPGPRPPLLPPDLARPVHLNYLHNCDRLRRWVVVGDDSLGALTGRRLKLATLVLARVIARRPDPQIGIMLPASAGAGLLIMATLLARKVPVMLNWTMGDANLQHVLEAAQVRTILTSGRFLDQLDKLDLAALDDRLLTLERIRQEETRPTDKLWAWVWSQRSPASIAAAFGSAGVGPDDRAVILFTSGSESTPKGVPLTHRNVQSNIAGCLQSGAVRSEHVLYGFLPPFHSFGFTVTTLLPLLCGLKTAYYPNPTDSRRLAAGIAAWQPNLLAGTPTFIAGIFRAARPGQLQSLRRIVCGAEKTPDELVEAARRLCGAEVLEGYGITETSPVLSINRPGQPRIGVGPALPGQELRIVDPETQQPLPSGQRGLILAHGPNVFGGYLDRDSSSAFVEQDGRRWYLTGDLGFLDAQGNLTIAGRLKRFVKVGGEMISLPAMEAAIQARHPNVDGTVRSAIAYLDRPGDRPLLCLYTCFPLSVEDANAILREAGFTTLARLNLTRQLEALPVLGTGKCDYRGLTALLAREDAG